MEIKKDLVQSLYESHHKSGKRFDQSFLKKRRGQLFSDWIGTEIKVLDLGVRDGTLTKYFSIEEIVTLKGGKLSKEFPTAFARNIAFRCIKKIQNSKCS